MKIVILNHINNFVFYNTNLFTCMHFVIRKYREVQEEVE